MLLYIFTAILIFDAIATARRAIRVVSESVADLESKEKILGIVVHFAFQYVVLALMVWFMGVNK